MKDPPRAPSEDAGRHAEPCLWTPNAGVPPSAPLSPPGVRTERGGAGEETAAFPAFAAFAETPRLPRLPEIFDSFGVFDPAPRTTPPSTPQTRNGAKPPASPTPPPPRTGTRAATIPSTKPSTSSSSSSPSSIASARCPPRRRLGAHPPQPRGMMSDPSPPCALNPRRRRPGRRSAFVPSPSGDAARA